MKKYSYINRFKYWLDKQMAKGTVSIVRLLVLTIFSVAIFVSIFTLVFRLSDAIVSTLWDSIVSIFNSSMPSSEEGGLVYIILHTITAVVGLMFSSLLIGILSSAVEAKVESLREGDSVVLEEGHTVILGYNFGEHGLLKQLILAAGDEDRCIVILTDIEKPEIEQDIQDSIDIPKNIEIICRHGDITDVNDLRCCSIEKSRVIIINALNDYRRIRSLLAVSALKKEYPECETRIVTCISDKRNSLPASKLISKKISIMNTDDLMAKIIAHTSTEPGLSVAFKDILNFENSEFYLEQDERFSGKTILELTSCVNFASIIGLIRNDKYILNPSRDMLIEENDTLILFEEKPKAYEIQDISLKNVTSREYQSLEKWPKGSLTIFGYNKLLDAIINGLSSDIDSIILASDYEEESQAIIEKHKELNISYYNDYEDNIEQLAQESDHIIILPDIDEDKEKADTEVIILVLKLMDIKERMDYSYNITAELHLESSRNVALKNRSIDYIVGSNIASLTLAQISENHKLEKVFDEILSKDGNELYSKPIRSFNINTSHDFSNSSLKQITLSYKYTLLGYIHNNQTILNPDLNDRIELNEDDRLIVLGND